MTMKPSRTMIAERKERSRRRLRSFIAASVWPLARKELRLLLWLSFQELREWSLCRLRSVLGIRSPSQDLRNGKLEFDYYLIIQEPQDELREEKGND